MFQALSSALAPDVPAIVDFRHHWSHFLRYYAERKPLSHKSQPVERTHLVFHLEHMCKLLLEEDRRLGQADGDGSASASALGPCLEYVIHRQMLDILSSLCQADTPPGIRPHLLKIFVLLLTRLRTSLAILPYVTVYLPLRRLLMLSCIAKASPTETQELLLITSLVSKMKQRPELLTLFAHRSGPQEGSRCSSRRSSAASSMIDLSQIESLANLPSPALLEEFESQHLIVSALLNLIDSADYMVAVKAMDTLMLVLSLPDQSAAERAVDGTSLCEDVTKRLAKLFEAIPEDVETGMVEEVKVNWVEAHHMHSSTSQLPDFHGKAELVAFYSWLDFCDNLVKTSLELVSEALAQAIREDFLERCLEPKLLPPSLPSLPGLPGLSDVSKLPNRPELPNQPEQASLHSRPEQPQLPNQTELPGSPDQPQLSNLPDLPNPPFLSGRSNQPELPDLPSLPGLPDLPGLPSRPNLLPNRPAPPKPSLLACLTQCWAHIHSDGLAREFGRWLVGDGAAGGDCAGVVTHPLKHELLRLCRADADAAGTPHAHEVSAEALRLFDTVLERPCDPILRGLVFGCLEQRGYYNASLAESQISSWSDEEDERERTRTDLSSSPIGGLPPSSPLQPPSPSRTLSAGPGPSRTLAPNNIARVINAWLYLVPDSLRTPADASRDAAGYEQYVKNAQQQVVECFSSCQGFSWPREAVNVSLESRSEGASSADSRPEADGAGAGGGGGGANLAFYEGEFLATLLQMLETLLERDHVVGLQVTSILSRLALLPHPYLHEYLLNPTLPLVPGTRTLYSTMRRVLERVRQETEGIEQLQRKIYVCRRTLMGSQSDRLALNLTRRETKLIDGLIILEEFGKEMAAITLVKYHMAC